MKVVAMITPAQKRFIAGLRDEMLDNGKRFKNESTQDWTREEAGKTIEDYKKRLGKGEKPFYPKETKREPKKATKD